MDKITHTHTEDLVFFSYYGNKLPKKYYKVNNLKDVDELCGSCQGLLKMFHKTAT